MRRLPPKFYDIVKKEADCTLNAGIVTPVESFLTSSLMLVSKKDGRLMFCIDCQKLNVVTIRDRFPMALVYEIFDEVEGSTIFTMLEII